MRRLIAYIIAAISMLLAIGVAATPVITKLNTGRDFTSGRDYREISFRIGEVSDKKKNDVRAEKVAEEMRNRLDNYKIEDYSVKVQGEDTVAVAFDLSSTEYNYVAKYISFSGDDFALVSSNGKPESVRNGITLFNPEDVEIEYTDLGGVKVPVVVITVTDEGKTAITDLCKEFTSSEDSGNSRAKTRAEDDDIDDTQKNYLYLWANFDDLNGEGYDTIEEPVCRDKVLMAFDADNIWYDEDETKISYMCAHGTAEDAKQLDISGLETENAKANYLMNMLQASKYDYELSCPTVEISKASGVDYYKNARVLSASAEPIISLGNNINIKMSATFIASIIAIIIVSLLLIVYYRISAIAMIASTLAVVFVTLISFTSMSVLFNIPAIIGFILLTAGALFGQIVYVNRFKEEIYKGRSIKKANQEASKKSNLLTLDSAILLAFAGLMMYAIGQSALKSMGVVLFFGAVFTLLINLLVFKLLMFLVSNSTNLQDKYFVFNVDAEKVPNLLAPEEKTPYEAPYEKVDFTKKKSLVSIIFGALSVAALTCIIVFGVTKKSPLNVEKAISDTTVVYTSIKTDDTTPVVHDVSTYVSYVLENTELAKKTGIEKNIDYKEVNQYNYNSDDKKDEKYYFFTVTLDEKLDDDRLSKLQETLNLNMDDLYSGRDESVTYSEVKTSKELVYTPSQGNVALATGITIVGIALYFAFRFRPSRGIAILVTTTGATMIAYGALAGMHFIGTTALTSVAMPLVAVTMLLASLFYLSTEKAMLKEGHASELTHEQRKEIMVKALGKSAAPLFSFLLVNIYIIINFFGFGVENSAMLFVSAIIGEIAAVMALLCIVGPLSMGIEKLFKKIHLPKFKFLQRNKNKPVQKRNSSEPEETIFIGIND